MSSEEEKRLASSLKTPTGAFSEITALSQRAINNAMGALLVEYPDLAKVNASLEGVGTLKATAEKPQIALKVSGASRADAVYYCKLSSGILQFKAGSNNDPIDIRNWTIAFRVQIDQVKVEPGSQEDVKVRSAIQQPGDFSIVSLYLTFNDSEISNFLENETDFNGTELTKNERLYLGVILASWYAGDDGVMSDRQKRTIAYGLQTSKPDTVNEQAATFPPTSLKFQTYEYIAPNETTPNEGLTAGDNNMLLYLQMTDHQPFPKEAILSYSGNFVSKGMDGTMCINRDIFWDSYLLRETTPLLLHTFNPYTYVWVKSANVEKPIAPVWQLGLPDPNHGDPSFYYWKSNPNDPLEWTWKPNAPEQSCHIKGERSNESCHINIDCVTTNSLKAQRGSNEILASGKTDILIKADSFGAYFPSIVWNYNYTIHIWITWSTKITIDAVEAGGLKISLNIPEDTSQVFKVDSEDLQFKGDTGGFNTLESVRQQFENVKSDLVNKMKNIPFGEAQEQLQKNLDNAARFVVPGGGTFIYKRPVFNNNGDLMIESSYKS